MQGLGDLTPRKLPQQKTKAKINLKEQTQILN
jgi:hypothetical protein